MFNKLKRYFGNYNAETSLIILSIIFGGIFSIGAFIYGVEVDAILTSSAASSVIPEVLFYAVMSISLMSAAVFTGKLIDAYRTQRQKSLQELNQVEMQTLIDGQAIEDSQDVIRQAQSKLTWRTRGRLLKSTWNKFPVETKLTFLGLILGLVIAGVFLGIDPSGVLDFGLSLVPKALAAPVFVLTLMGSVSATSARTGRFYDNFQKYRQGNVNFFTAQNKIHFMLGLLIGIVIAAVLLTLFLSTFSGGLLPMVLMIISTISGSLSFGNHLGKHFDTFMQSNSNIIKWVAQRVMHPIQTLKSVYQAAKSVFNGVSHFATHGKFPHVKLSDKLNNSNLGGMIGFALGLTIGIILVATLGSGVAFTPGVAFIVVGAVFAMKMATRLASLGERTGRVIDRNHSKTLLHKLIEKICEPAPGLENAPTKDSNTSNSPSVTQIIHSTIEAREEITEKSSTNQPLLLTLSTLSQKSTQTLKGNNVQHNQCQRYHFFGTTGSAESANSTGLPLDFAAQIGFSNQVSI
ncbi:MAG: hypothetical protein Tsb005_12970 [Gammaproteobacteria bacterium]